MNTFSNIPITPLRFPEDNAHFFQPRPRGPIDATLRNAHLCPGGNDE